MNLTAEEESRASLSGIDVLRERPEAADPRVLLGGSAVLLDATSPVAEVVVSVLPDRAMLDALERQLRRPVLVSVASPEIVASLVPDTDPLTRILSAATTADGVLMAPGQFPIAVFADGSRRKVDVDAYAGRIGGAGSVISVSGVRWRVSARSSGLVVARRLLGHVPEASALGIPLELLRAVSEGQGRFALVGGFGSGRSLVLASLVSRALESPGRHALLVSDEEEYLPVRRGSLLERASASELSAALLTGLPAPDVTALDVRGLNTPPDSLVSPLVLMSADAPVPGFRTVAVSRTASGVSVGLPA